MSYRFPVGHGRDPQRAGRPVGDLSPQRACPLGVERIRLESIRRPMQRSQRGRRGQPGKRASPAAEDVADESGSVDGQVQRLPSAHVVQRQSDGSAVDHSGEGPYGVHRHQPGVLGLLDPICLAVRDLGDNVNLALRRTDQVQSLLRGHVVRKTISCRCGPRTLSQYFGLAVSRTRAVRSSRCIQVAASGSAWITASSV